MRLILFILAMAVIIGAVSAAPVTGAVTLAGSNNMTLHSTGAVGITWFEYGLTSGYLSWKTPNATATDPYEKWVYGSPLIAGQKYYVRACDTTGCGAEVFATLAAATPAPQPTFGYIYQNLTESGFDPVIVAYDAVQPYFWVAPQPVIWGLLFFFMFAAMWMRGRDVLIPSILGMIAGFVAFNPTYGVAIPAVFVGMSQGIVYASMAGIIMSIFKR